MNSDYDVVALGRIAIDLYGEQFGTALDETLTFRRYVGGSAGNMAVGAARLGLEVAMLSRVGADPMGEFVRRTLRREGVDASRTVVDAGRRTALAFLGMQRPDAVSLDFYRENAADAAIRIEDADRAAIARAKVLVISGSQFAVPETATEIGRAIEAARAGGCRVAIDVDFRGPIWAAHPGGVRGTAAAILAAAAEAAILVGNEEEFAILGRAEAAGAAIEAVRSQTKALLILKQGASGSTAFAPGEAGGTSMPGFPVPALNVVGAGDAFLAGFLSRWVKGAPVAEALRWGNANGALVVSRHACSDAMPFPAEIEALLRGDGADAAGLEAIARIHRLAKRVPAQDNITALAFDHRVPFRDLMRKSGKTLDDARRFKGLIADAARRVAGERGLEAPGVLVDETFGADAMEAFTRDGWWVARPLEVTGSRPLRLEAGDGLETAVDGWHPRHVGKCLVWYHPNDADALKRDQLATLKRIDRACADRNREWMLEIILPLDMVRDDDLLLEAVEEIYATGLRPDWLKLPGLAPAAWSRLEAFLASADPGCRGVIMLGLNQPAEDLFDPVAIAAGAPACKGFAIGRTIFMDAADAWFADRMTDAEAVDRMAAIFDRLVASWNAGRAAAPAARFAMAG